MKSIHTAMAMTLAASLFLLGCIGASEGDKCTGETTITINNVTKACVDGKMTGSCAVEGQVYSESSDSKIVCEGGIWVSRDKVAEAPAANVSANDTNDSVPAADDDAEPCEGEAWYTVPDETGVCMDGKYTSTCTTEGAVYAESEFLNARIICEGGTWVNKELVPEGSETTEPEATVDDGSCIRPSFSTVDEVTEACIDGVMTTECTTEGEVYSESEFLQVKVVCEGGVWVSKDLE